MTAVPRPRITDPRAIPVAGHDAHLAAVARERLTPQALRERFAAPPPWTPEKLGDGGQFDGYQRSNASVLVPLVERDDGLTLLLTQRTAHLRDHAGQISFPGGRCDEGDCTPERTALREAHEEIGLEAERVQLLGRLPEYRTSTGFSVTPVVGWAEPPVSYRPDPHEVAEVFEVPLAFLLDSRNHRYESAFFKGRIRKYWAMPFGERFIWGATAGMLVTFQRILVAA